MSLLSVCIPTYEMGGLGHVFLKQSLDKLSIQTFKDFEVVVSDHSKNTLIKDLCSNYKDTLNIKYIKNTLDLGSSSANINNAIKNANGKLIKILFQDDFLASEKSLDEICANFDLNKDHWLVTACIRSKDGINLYDPFYPKYNRFLYLGKNTIGPPSVMTIKNDRPLLFNSKLIWLMDCDYYKRYYDLFGKPKLINNINIVNRIGPHQISNTIINVTSKIKETIYMFKKYNL